MKVVLYYSHPTEPKSAINTKLIAALRQNSDVTVRWLDELYPNFKMTPEQVNEEHALIEKAEAVFFQFPVYWYSSPPSLKAFMDQVMTYGWAFGSKSSLKGRKFRAIYTCGAKSESYKGEFGANDIAKPFNQSFKFCGCEPLTPFVVFLDSDQDAMVGEYLALFK